VVGGGPIDDTIVLGSEDVLFSSIRASYYEYAGSDPLVVRIGGLVNELQGLVIYRTF
jgi:hypothetical protein